MSWSFAAIVGSAAGGLVVLVIFIGYIWLSLLRCKGFSNKSSETGSSAPSTLVEWTRTGQISSYGGAPDHQGARQFSIEELEQATKKFSEHNLVGVGSFGLVYKGLLLDGTIIAIKKRQQAPREEFIEEVNSLSTIRHRNIVTLIGYCQDSGLQMLVFEYVPNRSICSHLYGKMQTTKLEFKQRLSIAIGAAKGLAHLHSLSPPLVHGNFKTSNVLVDENFIAKVADAGLVKLLERIDDAAPSQASVRDVFKDPQVGQLGMLSEITDAYSFGVFILELITGSEVVRLMAEVPSESLTKLNYVYRKSFKTPTNATAIIVANGSGTVQIWKRDALQWLIGEISAHVAYGKSIFKLVVVKVEAHLRSDTLIDERLGNSFTYDGMKELVVLTLRCLSSPGRRPKMEHIVRELDRILETEMTQTTVMGDGTAMVTLGSQLFTS